MSSTKQSDECTFLIENIGGIDRSRITIEPGVTVLVGRNATNRTSLLRAIMTVYGSGETSLKADAERGNVVMELDGEQYSRELERVDGTVVTSGEPYLDDPELADLFAFLLESNEARQAVARGADLRELIMRPVDTARIQAEVEQLVDRKRQLDEELDELTALKRELPQLERDRSQLESDIADLESELQEKESEVEAASGSLEGQKQKKSRLQEQMETLRDKRSTLDDIRYRIETQEQKLDAFREERQELETRRDSLSRTDLENPGEIEERIETLRQEKQEATTELNDLQSIVQFNEQMLDGAAGELLAALTGAESGSEASVTDQLVTDKTITCWTCQTRVDRTQIESTVATLREQAREKQAEIDTLDDELDTLRDGLEEFHERENERERIDRKLDDIEDRRRETEAQLDSLRERRSAVRNEIRDIESEIDTLETEQSSDLLELHKEANELEYELGRLESELADVEAEIAKRETRLEEESEMKQRREDIESRIVDRRTEIERLENDAVETFNDHMAEVLDVLGYENLERIWIERVETRSGAATAEQASFELHVVRATESGTTYEDTIDHLSESEREVTGLVFALAGYLVHDVHESVPVMLLDSVEAIDSDRISRIVEYFESYSRYLVVALLPEDAAGLDEQYSSITDI